MLYIFCYFKRTKIDTEITEKSCHFLKDEINIIENNILLQNKEVLYYKNLHMKELSSINLLKDEIRKLNKSISKIKREKEPICNEILQIKKHIQQMQSKILKQSQLTKEFLNNVVKFSNKLKKESSY